MTFHIYHLVDPNDNSVRYVGRCTDPKARLRHHCAEAQRRNTTAKHRWINALLQAHTLPVVVIVAKYADSDADAARNAENAEIVRHQKTIYNLLDPLKFPSIIAKKGKK